MPPAELEALLLTHPEVSDAAVIGVYNEDQATELPRAYVVLSDGKGDDSAGQKIIGWVAERVANHKKLRGCVALHVRRRFLILCLCSGVRFVDEIPKSPSGKILRRVLKEQAAKEGQTKAKL